MGRSVYQPPEIEGRVLVKHDTAVNLMQVYTMVPFRDEVEYNAGIRKLMNRICVMYPTLRAPKIPVLPEKFLYSMVAQYGGGREGQISLGLHKETVEVRGFDKSAAPFLILGDAGKGKTNLLKVILEQLAGKHTVYLFDSSSRELFYHKTAPKVTYLETKEEGEEFIDEFEELVAVRKSLFHKALEENPRISPKIFYASLDEVYLVIDDTDEFAEKYAFPAKKMAECLRFAIDTGCGIIVAVHTTKPKGFDEVSKFFKAANDGILVGNPGATSIFPNVAARQLPALGEGLLYRNGGYEKLLLPKFEE